MIQFNGLKIDKPSLDFFFLLFSYCYFLSYFTLYPDIHPYLKLHVKLWLGLKNQNQIVATGIGLLLWKHVASLPPAAVVSVNFSAVCGLPGCDWGIIFKKTLWKRTRVSWKVAVWTGECSGGLEQDFKPRFAVEHPPVWSPMSPRLLSALVPVLVAVAAAAAAAAAASPPADSGQQEFGKTSGPG